MQNDSSKTESVECERTEEGWIIKYQGRSITVKDKDLYYWDSSKLAQELGCEPNKLVELSSRIDEYEITKPLSLKELQDILGLTVKQDNTNKIITFLCMLSAYTEDSQFNISFRAESSTGKSYIPLEIMQLFPHEDVKDIGYSSPKAFFHEKGEWNNDLEAYVLDLERKILIFLDQPHDMLLQYLRPLLSHDKKELSIMITDKSERKGLRTKKVILRGYPSVVFCTASLKVEEQEATRMILLSPEVTQEKIREAIKLKAQREGDPIAFKEWLDKEPRRKYLKERIKRIRDEKIKHVIIPNYEAIEERFIKERPILKPRHSRDISRIISLIKSLALLNLFNRERKDGIIIASQEDIDQAFNLYKEISESQELGIAPYIYRLYKEIIKPLYEKSQGKGVLRKEILVEHQRLYGRPLPYSRLEKEILPALESQSLITQEPDPENRRLMRIFIPEDVLTKEESPTLRGIITQGKSETCSVCGKPTSRQLVRDSKVVFLHEECEEKYPGKL